VFFNTALLFEFYQMSFALAGDREERENRKNSDSTSENVTMNERDGYCYVSFFFIPHILLLFKVTLKSEMLSSNFGI
jgi:hypothetical protein